MIWTAFTILFLKCFHLFVLFFLLFFTIIILLYWRSIVTFTKAPTTYHCWIHPSIILLYPPSPIPGMVSTGLTFPFLHECIIFQAVVAVLCLHIVWLHLGPQGCQDLSFHAWNFIPLFGMCNHCVSITAASCSLCSVFMGLTYIHVRSFRNALHFSQASLYFHFPQASITTVSSPHRALSPSLLCSL
jgi:hypothetical protein